MSTPRHDRLIELLADRALFGLPPMEQIELAELMLELPGEETHGYDRAAAAIALAAIDLEPMPPGLAEKIEKEAHFAASTEVSVQSSQRAHAATERAHASTIAMPDAPMRPQPSPSAPPVQAHLAAMHSQPPIPVSTRPADVNAPPSNVVPYPSPQSRPPVAKPSGASRAFAVGGWVAAAACLVLAIGAFVYRTKPIGPVSVSPSSTVPSSTAPNPTAPVTVASVTPPPSVREETAAALRERLLSLKTTAKMDWAATKDPAAKGATGEVLWNAEEQKGTMRFRGLAKNDATKAQYQLWIFDKGREDKYPVDGGVFDIDSETGDVIVAIKARLQVDKAALFAVTVERPGGVVVSKRERIVVTAKPTG